MHLASGKANALTNAYQSDLISGFLILLLPALVYVVC